MLIKSKGIYYYFCVLFFLFNLGLSQEIYFPLVYQTNDDFSSAYGARNLGTENYPGIGYDYDFHAALDIAAPDESPVFPVCDGIISKYDEFEKFIIIKHVDSQGEFLVKYLHISLEDNIGEGDYVSYDNEIGTIDFPSAPHLDIRYTEESTMDEDCYSLCLNPGRLFIDYENAPDPYLVVDDGSEYGYTIYSLAQLDEIKTDDRGPYIEIGINTDDDILDFDEMLIFMEYNENGYNYDTEDLLNTSNIKAGHEFNSVRFEERNNCGDLMDADDDEGVWSSSVRIIPKRFDHIYKDYHVIFFRWYLDPAILNTLPSSSAIKINVDLYDWDGFVESYTNISVPTCIDCNPPSSAPAPPINVIAQYIETPPGIKLVWDQGVGAEADYYKLYRCPASEAMTDEDAIDISSAFDQHYYYIDNSPSLVLGETYKYAIAGVNYAGEGLNSEEIIVQNAPPFLEVTVEGPSTLAYKSTGTYYGEAMGGNPPYSYSWYRQFDNSTTWYYGSALNPVSFRMGRTGFTLKCIAQDQDGVRGEQLYHVAYGFLEPWAIDELEFERLPNQFRLFQNQPNPFNPSTTIRFEIPLTSHTTLKIYNIKGQQVDQLCNEVLIPGFYAYSVDGAGLPSGTYFYKLAAGEYREIKKMILVK